MTEMQKVYGDYLSLWRWNWYCTMTFRDQIHPDRATKAWDIWINRINRSIFGTRYWKRPSDGVIWVRSIEQQSRGTIHFHGLIGRVRGLDRFFWEDEWERIGGFARIRSYDYRRGGRFYIVKNYGNGAEIDFGGPLPDRDPLFL